MNSLVARKQTSPPPLAVILEKHTVPLKSDYSAYSSGGLPRLALSMSTVFLQFLV